MAKAKTITGQAKFQVPGGQATPAPPVGTSLGKFGINLGQFVSQFNERTRAFNGIPIPSNKMSSEMTWRGSVRARAGYAVDRFLPFVTAGIAFGRYELTPNYALTGPLPDSTVHVGPTLGLGVEYALTDRLNTRIEYRYTDFGDANYKIPGFGGFFESRTELKTHDIKLGLSYKF